MSGKDNGETIQQSTITGSYTIIDNLANTKKSENEMNKNNNTTILPLKIYTNRDKYGVLAQIESLQTEKNILKDQSLELNKSKLLRKNILL